MVKSLKKVTKKITKRPIKAVASDLMPECERQSTLVMAHIGHLLPILTDLPPAMVLELRDSVLQLQDALEAVVKTMKRDGRLRGRDCFSCDGSCEMCNICGESVSACQCPEDDRHPCEDCRGTGRTVVIP